MMIVCHGYPARNDYRQPISHECKGLGIAQNPVFPMLVVWHGLIVDIYHVNWHGLIVDIYHRAIHEMIWPPLPLRWE